MPDIPNHLFSAARWAPSHDLQSLATLALHRAISLLGLDPFLASSAPFIRHYTFFVVGCAIYATASYALFALLNAAWPAFFALGVKPSTGERWEDKRMYVVANLLKSAVLGMQALSPSWWFYSAQEYACNLAPLGAGVSRAVGAPWGVEVLPCAWNVDRGHDDFVKAISACYILTDVVALATVPRLPLTTKIHHWATFAFGLWVLAVPIAPTPVLHKLLMYGAFSTLAFPVNAFLALRCTNPESPAVGALAGASLALYVGVCAVNWGLHVLWLASGSVLGTVSVAEYVYAASLYFFVQDDLILMGWLASYGKKRGGSKSSR